MIPKTVTRPLGLAALLLAGSAAAHAAITVPVKTDKGLISGTAGKEAGVTVFKGIPFAAPPVGKLRWAPPAPGIWPPPSAPW